MSSRRSRKRRQPQPDHVQPVEEILAEEALPHARIEILVRGRDHAHVRLERRVAAHAIEVRRRRARAAAASAAPAACRRSRRGRASRPRPARSARAACDCAPVKAPRSWPKSSVSSRSFGIAAVLIAMNGLAARGLWRCSAFATSSLPVPGLARDEHGRVRLREPADRAEHFLHRLRLAEDLRGRFAHFAWRSPAACSLRPRGGRARPRDRRRRASAGTRMRRPGTRSPRSRGPSTRS